MLEIIIVKPKNEMEFSMMIYDLLGNEVYFIKFFGEFKFV